ncbi:MAG: site-specific DNA-methyltransferase [Sedimentisphaerales bacterium]|nr:site-specific DNA-methyltransferase [Sedimentisphaerales bacterium]
MNQEHKIESGIINADCVGYLRDLLSRHNNQPFADLVFADPPFNIGYSYDKYDDELAHDEYVKWSRQWMEVCRDCLTQQGSMWIAIGDEYAAELKVILRELGMNFRNWIIWYYTFGQNTKKKFSRSHAHILYYTKDPKNFIFNDMEIRVPSARQMIYDDKRADSRGRIPDDTWILRPQQIEGEAFDVMEDTWHIPRVCGTFKERQGFHGCQMPEKLLERIIKVASNPDGVVIDPFCGSGTTAAVACKLDRRYLTFDISENYVEQAKKRIDAIREQKQGELF